MGRFLILTGILLVLVGLMLTYGPRLPVPLGRLPGDILIQRDKFTFAFPIVTCLILSLILTILANLFFRR